MGKKLQTLKPRLPVRTSEDPTGITQSSWQLVAQPRRWQVEALALWKQNYSGIASVVTGAGKTLFAEMCMLAVREEHPEIRFIIVVPTITLLDQWYISLVEDLRVPQNDIACFSGEEKPSCEKTVNVCVINTARKVGPQIASLHKSCLVVDECHRAGSPINAQALTGPHTATLGLSATPVREYDDGYETFLAPVLGETIYEYDYKQALQDHVISPFELVNVRIDLLPNEKRQYDRLSGAAMRERRRLEHGEGSEDHLKRLLQRRATVSSLAIMRIPTAGKLVDEHRGERTIVFHENIKAANTLYHVITKRKHSVTLYHSGISPIVRRDNLRLYRRGAFDVLSCRALDEGMNVPETTVAIVASSGASSRQRIQRLGRAPPA